MHHIFCEASTTFDWICCDSLAHQCVLKSVSSTGTQIHMKTPLLLSFFSALVGGFVAIAILGLFHPSDVHSKGHDSVLPAFWTPPPAALLAPAPLRDLNSPANPISPMAEVDFRGAANEALDAVVHVRTLQKVSRNDHWSSFFGQTQAPAVQRGSGSGVILTEDGYIVTNHHVIEGADEIEIGLNDNRSYPARLIGSDPATDIAVLQIQADELTSLPWGSSDQLQVGDWVLAVGNPFDLTSTVTAGIVSAKGRDLRLIQPDRQNEIFPVESFIQTDAAVNPGNSGGALVNVGGELVGINTAIASRTGSYAGYAFAVPASLAKKVALDLMEFGHVQRAYIGVSIQPVNEAIADQLELPEVAGVLVASTTAGSGAEEAGITSGDVILSVGGTPTSSLPSLLECVNRYRPGQKAEVQVWRNNGRQTFMVELRDREGQTAIRRPPSHSEMTLLGGKVKDAELNGQWGAQIADPGSGPFANADIPAGTIIVAANSQLVRSAKDLSRLLTAAEKEGEKGVLIEGLSEDGNPIWFGLSLR